MNITNRFGLPQAFVNFVNRDRHHKEGDYSCTELISSPRQYFLKVRHYKDITKDVIDFMPSMIGTALHHIIEKGAGMNDIAEGYLEVEVAGKIVSCMADVYNTEHKKMTDWKSTKVVVLGIDRAREDWEKQLNINSFIYSENDFPVEKLEVTAYLKDFMKGKAENDQSYPRCEVMTYRIKKWEKDQQLKYLEERVRLFSECENLPDDLLPGCSDDERWLADSEWIVWKDGGKRATKAGFETKEAADEFREFKFAGKPEYKTVERKGNEVFKCIYCDGREFCSQYEFLIEKQKKAAAELQA